MLDQLLVCNTRVCARFLNIQPLVFFIEEGGGGGGGVGIVGRQADRRSLTLNFVFADIDKRRWVDSVGLKVVHHRAGADIVFERVAGAGAGAEVGEERVRWCQ